MEKMEMKIHDGTNIRDIATLLNKKDAAQVLTTLKDVLYTVIVNKGTVTEENKQTLLPFHHKLHLADFTSDSLLSTFPFLLFLFDFFLLLRLFFFFLNLGLAFFLFFVCVFVG